jgi:spore maturation protein CgeB
MKSILIVDTIYPSVLNNFYKKISVCGNMSDNSLMSLFFKSRFGTSDTYSFYLEENGWVAKTLIANSHILSKSASLNSIDLIRKYLFKYDLSSKIFARIFEFKAAFLNEYQNTLLNHICVYKPDVIYFQDLNFLNEVELDSLKKSGIFLTGQIASPLPSNQILRKFDHIYSSLPNLVNEIQDIGVSSSFLPIGFDSRIFNEIPPNSRRHLLSFVGGISSIHSSTIPLLQTVIEQHPELRIYGYGKKLTNSSRLIHNAHLGEAWGLDMYKIFQNSYLTLNRHSLVSGQYANNMRLFESTGMGSLLLTDNKINISDYFIPNEEILVYDNFQHASDLVKWVKDNPGKARKIAENGLKRTLQDHTYEKVIGNLSKDLKNRL